MSNPSTNDVFDYLLEGLVTEPLAQEHIILKCVLSLLLERKETNQKTNPHQKHHQ
jgi:hypothetical protein